MSESTRPNVICFVTDQLRADHLACYGNPDVRTPNIDRLAREGVRFTESYVANPVCSPNRASMFTGRYPKAHRLRENGNTLPLDETTLPGVLREAGYATASFGKIHLAPFGLTDEVPAEDHERVESSQFWAEGGELPLPYYGLEHAYYVGGHGHYTFGHYRRELEREHPGAWEKLLPENPLEPPSGVKECWKASIPEELHYNTVIADRTIQYLERRDDGEPFFIWCSFPDPHHPWSPPAPWCDRYAPEEVSFEPARREGELDDLPPYMRERAWTGPDVDEQFREIHALEYGMISMVDHQIGRVLAALEERGLMEETVVVFLSDHGDLMGDHRLSHKGPFFFRGLMRSPTIIRLPGTAGRRRASDALFSTVDLCPTLLDLAGLGVPEGVQGLSFGPVLMGEADSLRDRIYAEYDTTGHGDRLRYLRSARWALTYYLRNDCGLLFDLESDPEELHNLWRDPGCAGQKRDLLEALLRETAAADDWLPPKRCHA
ncbi:MAG: sulfatase-like hydrolase/transferase [Candidatus Brocadiaceae bacterium]|jgi:arylsulfatase A-like enzyme